MNTDDLTPDDIVEFVTPSLNAKGGIIDSGGIFGTGKFVQVIKRRKSGRQDVILTNNLEDKITIQPEWIRWERTEYYNQKTVE
jgi:hypothetical protein